MKTEEQHLKKKKKGFDFSCDTAGIDATEAVVMHQRVTKIQHEYQKNKYIP